MINFITKNSKLIYLGLALLYALGVPLIVSLDMRYQFYNVFNIFPLIIGGIAIVTFIIFMIECFRDETNIFGFIKKNKAIFFLMLSFIFLFIACVRGTNVEKAFLGVRPRFGGFIAYIYYAFLAILGYKLDVKYRKIFFRSIIVVATILSFLGLINSPGIQPYVYSQYSSIFFNENHFASYLTYAIVLLIFCIYNDKNIIVTIIDMFCFIILNAMLTANNSFGSYLTVIFVLVVSLMFVIKNKLYVKYGVLVGLFIFVSLIVKINGSNPVGENFKELAADVDVIKDYSSNIINDKVEESEKILEDRVVYIGSCRGELWYYSWDLIKKKPLLGYGLESLRDEFAQYPMHTSNDMPHNLIIYLLAVGGILTLLPYLINYGILLVKNRKAFWMNKPKTMIYFIILAHLFSSMFNNTIFYVTSLYAVIFGMIFTEEKEDEEEI